MEISFGYFGSYFKNEKWSIKDVTNFTINRGEIQMGNGK